MCGIYGQIAKSAELNVDHQIQACNSISCRGPDSQGLVLGNSINQQTHSHYNKQFQHQIHKQI